MAASKTPANVTQPQSPTSGGRTQRLPAVKYNFSPTSARAAGLNGQSICATPLTAKQPPQLTVGSFVKSPRCESYGHHDSQNQNGVNGILHSSFQDIDFDRKQSTTTPDEDVSSS